MDRSTCRRLSLLVAGLLFVGCGEEPSCGQTLQHDKPTPTKTAAGGESEYLVAPKGYPPTFIKQPAEASDRQAWFIRLDGAALDVGSCQLWADIRGRSARLYQGVLKSGTAIVPDRAPWVEVVPARAHPLLFTLNRYTSGRDGQASFLGFTDGVAPVAGKWEILGGNAKPLTVGQDAFGDGTPSPVVCQDILKAAGGAVASPTPLGALTLSLVRVPRRTGPDGESRAAVQDHFGELLALAQPDTVSGWRRAGPKLGAGLDAPCEAAALSTHTYLRQVLPELATLTSQLARQANTLDDAPVRRLQAGLPTDFERLRLDAPLTDRPIAQPLLERLEPTLVELADRDPNQLSGGNLANLHRESERVAEELATLADQLKGMRDERVHQANPGTPPAPEGGAATPARIDPSDPYIRQIRQLVGTLRGLAKQSGELDQEARKLADDWQAWRARLQREVP